MKSAIEIESDGNVMNNRRDEFLPKGVVFFRDPKPPPEPDEPEPLPTGGPTAKG